VLWGMLFGTRILADPAQHGRFDARFDRTGLADPPRVEARFHRGRWVIAHWYRHPGGDAVRAFSSLELEGDRVARIVNYFYNPDFIEDLGAELGVPVRVNGHRFWQS